MAGGVGGTTKALRDTEPGGVFELPGCRARGVRREDGRFYELGVDAREARIAELVEGSQKLVGRINADQAALTTNTTELLGLFQANMGWGWGWRTPAHRLACELKLPGADARRLVTAADCLPDLPLLSAAFTNGEVPLPVVAALAEVATPDTEADLVEQTRHGTADAVLGLVSKFKRIERDAGDREERQNSFSLRAKADGYQVRGFLKATSGAAALKVMEQRCAELFEQTGTRANLAAGFLSLLETGPTPPASRFLAVLKIDVEVFRAWRERRQHGSATADGCTTIRDSSDGEPTDGGGETGVSVLDGPPVTEAELEAMHGDLSACWMVSRDGHPLWISSKQRTAPPWMRVAMAIEQPCCGAAGCDRSGILQAHHSVPYTTKPETLFDEQVFLCPFHHRALHAEGATVEFATDRKSIVIRDHRGRVMTLTGVPCPPTISPQDRPEWVGRGVWTGGMDSYDAYGTDVMLAHLQSGTEHPRPAGNQAAAPGDPPPTDSNAATNNSARADGTGKHGPPPAGGGHPADDGTTNGDNSGISPPTS